MEERFGIPTLPKNADACTQRLKQERMAVRKVNETTLTGRSMNQERFTGGRGSEPLIAVPAQGRPVIPRHLREKHFSATRSLVFFHHGQQRSSDTLPSMPRVDSEQPQFDHSSAQGWP